MSRAFGRLTMPDLDVLLMHCPGCGRAIEDHDGFGVLYDPECGYCQHADRYGAGVCTFCGDAE